MTTRVEFQSDPTGNAPPVTDIPADERPEWLPENFETGEDLAKSYKEAQAEITRLKQGKPATETPAEKKPNDLGIKTDDDNADTDAEDEAAKKAAESAGVDLDPYQQEFASTGDVTEEGRASIAKSLEKVLGPNARQVVDQYIDGRKTSASHDAAAIKDAAGGDEAYSTMVNWAATALSPQEISVFNSQVNSGDRTSAIFAVEALRSRFERANGADPRRFKGTFSPPSSRNVEKFKSSAEMTAAMKDPRYKSDPAYRTWVANRIP